MHEAAWGFVSGRRHRGRRQPRHAGQAVVACADIRSCFPSVGRGLVISVLRRDLGERFSDAALMRLVDIVLAEAYCSTGAPTSPHSSIDGCSRPTRSSRMRRTVETASYTRYADDPTFSGGDGVVGLLGIATGVLQRIGLELDRRKTNIFRKGRRQCCTGASSTKRDARARRLRTEYPDAQRTRCVSGKRKARRRQRLRESLTEALAGRKKEESK